VIMVYPKVSGLAAWSENCKWYSSLLLGITSCVTILSQPSEVCRHNTLCCFLTTVYCCKHIILYDSVRKLLNTPSYTSLYITLYIIVSLFAELFCPCGTISCAKCGVSWQLTRSATRAAVFSDSSSRVQAVPR